MRIAASFFPQTNLSFIKVLSSAVLLWLATTAVVWSHEVLPSIADMQKNGDRLEFEVRANLESFVAEVDLTGTTDINDTPQAQRYDELRALAPNVLEQQFTAFWPQVAAAMTISADDTSLTPVLDGVEIAPVGNLETVRTSAVRFHVLLPAGAETAQVGWAPELGVLVLRQMGVDAPYDGYLEAGAVSGPINLTGGDQATGWQSFLRYIPVGFDHIVPKGLDHILFVLGLFFLSAKMRPLLTQVSLFTLAHTITLALAALGYVTLPGSIVEPLIAASIVFVAVENIYMKGLSRWRPFIVFGFGLLHGLGFASVLGEFGLPEGSFIPALIGFNVGVELGQLAVIAVMFLCVWQALRVANGEGGDKQGLAIYGGLFLATIVLIILNPAAIAAAAEAPTWLFAAPLAAIFALCAMSIYLQPQADSYRRMVAIPASVAIAFVGAYWFAERVGLLGFLPFFGGTT